MDSVKLYKQAHALHVDVLQLKSNGLKVGFVPTMGALHEGHLNLIRRASKENDQVVVSVFVNPTQFNNKKDLELYPRMLDKDLEVLSSLDFELILFAPVIEEIYPENDSYEPIDLKGLDQVLEGAFRPGHFQGVAHVVRNLFRIVQPHKAYFGRKDLQQLAVIRHMTEHYGFGIEIIGCETLRDASGLAMSSRNLRLSNEQKEDALIICRTLAKVAKWSNIFSPEEVKEKALAYFSDSQLKLEYLEIVDDSSFQLLQEQWSENASCCIAAYCGDVRLIDNMSCKMAQ
jgi:pantoate--beta-alanine ligase